MHVEAHGCGRTALGQLLRRNGVAEEPDPTPRAPSGPSTRTVPWPGAPRSLDGRRGLSVMCGGRVAKSVASPGRDLESADGPPSKKNSWSTLLLAPQQIRPALIFDVAGSCKPRWARCPSYFRCSNSPPIAASVTFALGSMLCLHSFFRPCPHQTWSGPPLPQWGVKPTHLNLFSGRHLPRAMMPKNLKDKTRISAMMLKTFHISRPHGR